MEEINHVADKVAKLVSLLHLPSECAYLLIDGYLSSIGPSFDHWMSLHLLKGGVWLVSVAGRFVGYLWSIFLLSVLFVSGQSYRELPKFMWYMDDKVWPRMNMGIPLISSMCHINFNLTPFTILQIFQLYIPCPGWLELSQFVTKHGHPPSFFFSFLFFFFFFSLPH